MSRIIYGIKVPGANPNTVDSKACVLRDEYLLHAYPTEIHKALKDLPDSLKAEGEIIPLYVAKDILGNVLADGEYDTCPLHGPINLFADRRVVVKNNSVRLKHDPEYAFSVSSWFEVNLLVEPI